MSSGAIAAGLAPLGLKRRPSALAAQQAAAAVGQGLLVHRYTAELARHGIVAGQVLLTVDDVTRRAHYRNAHQTFGKLLELGVLPIVNENDTVATSEIRFGDNDRLAALVAHLVHADLLVLLSDVDGLYDGPPDDPSSTLVAEVAVDADLDGVRLGKPGAAGLGTGGMATKVEAARIATGAGIPVVLTSAPHAAAALAGDPVGTLFHATGRKRPIRLLWLAHVTEAHGHAHPRRRRRARRRRAATPRCWPPASPRSRGSSWPATRWTWPGPTARWSPAAWSASTPTSCPRSWAAPTSARSCTATTSCWCDCPTSR